MHHIVIVCSTRNDTWASEPKIAAMRNPSKPTSIAYTVCDVTGRIFFNFRRFRSIAMNT